MISPTREHTYVDFQGNLYLPLNSKFRKLLDQGKIKKSKIESAKRENFEDEMSLMLFVFVCSKFYFLSFQNKLMAVKGRTLLFKLKQTVNFSIF